MTLRYGSWLRSACEIRRYADGSWIPVKTLAIQIRVFCAASQAGRCSASGRRRAVESSSAT
jgi:hypothetical protein